MVADQPQCFFFCLHVMPLRIISAALIWIGIISGVGCNKNDLQTYHYHFPWSVWGSSCAGRRYGQHKCCNCGIQANQSGCMLSRADNALARFDDFVWRIGRRRLK
jgi:hypothetical protein